MAKDSIAPRTFRVATAHTARLMPLLAAVLVGQFALLLWTVTGRTALAGSVGLGGAPELWLAAQLGTIPATLVLLWRLALVATYRPTPGPEDAALPIVTVIVPAYNEGRQVFKTLRSLVQSDYPAHKLRIIAVNDGSQDDTWQWIRRAAQAFPEHVIALNGLINRGKRAALYEGFGRATGDVIVTVDSDSEVMPDTLRNLVAPFVQDESVGAVAGNVRVLNRAAGPLAAMLDVSFTYSFEFMRASQSRVDTVMCCPGALSAYRRAIVESCKDEWLTQTFMGRPANIGEDRAMTNMILRLGHAVRFQSNAIVLTEVPTNTAQLSKMFLRWARSNVRETLVLASFVFKKFRRGSALGARVNLLWLASGLLLEPFALGGLVLLLLSEPQLGVGLCAAAALSALLPATVYASSRSWRSALWAFPYAVYSLVCLSWITPYALLTPQRTSWLTRQLPSAAPRSPRVRRADQ